MKLRAMRNGVLTEFEFEDMGESRFAKGQYMSRFTVGDRWVTSQSGFSNVDLRLGDDLAAMAIEGYDVGKVEWFDGWEWLTI